MYNWLSIWYNRKNYNNNNYNVWHSFYVWTQHYDRSCALPLHCFFYFKAKIEQVSSIHPQTTHLIYYFYRFSLFNISHTWLIVQYRIHSLCTGFSYKFLRMIHLSLSFSPQPGVCTVVSISILIVFKWRTKKEYFMQWKWILIVGNGCTETQRVAHIFKNGILCFAIEKIEQSALHAFGI